MTNVPLIDLHVHTSCSDGAHTPAEVVRMAAEGGLTAVAITDHDTVTAIPEAIKTAKELIDEGITIEIVPGVEISAEGPRGFAIHVVGLYINPDSEDLTKLLQAGRDQRYMRIPLYLEKLSKLGIVLSQEEILELAGDAAPSRVHIARTMIKQGIVKNTDEAFDQYLGRDGKAYVSRYRPGCRESASVIRKAGGLPIIAHPALSLRDGMTMKELRSIIEDMLETQSEASLGIEVMHGDHTPEETSVIAGLAEEYGLIVSGGSDFHDISNNTIGRGRGNMKIGSFILNEIKKALHR